MRILLLAALSIGCLSSGSHADGGDADAMAATLLRASGNSDPPAGAEDKPFLFAENNDEEVHPLFDSNHPTLTFMEKSKRKKQGKGKKNKRKKRSKKDGSKGDKRDDSDDEGATPRPTPRPTRRPTKRTKRPIGGPGPNTGRPPNPEHETKFVDGNRHMLPPDSNHNNIVLERGSTLTITSGTSIYAKVGEYERGTSAISVKESSLKVQGMEISITGGVGGPAISFLNGSKGLIGCEDFQPPVTNNQQCAMGNAAPLELKNVCGINEHCRLNQGVCNNKSGAHYGMCSRVPEVCPLNYQPVCGCDGNTYGNTCAAHGAGTSVSREGNCDGTVEPPVELKYCEIDEGGGHDCGDEEVCLLDTGMCHVDAHTDHDYIGISEKGSDKEKDTDIHFPNSNMSMNKGKCVKRDEHCHEISMDVCTCDGKTHPNECALIKMPENTSYGLYGNGIAYRGKCDDNSGPTVDPDPPLRMCEIGHTVLPSCYSGEYCELAVGTCNADSTLPMRGVGACVKSSEVCPAVYTPVCGCDGRTYSNSCIASRKRMSIAYMGKCRDDNNNPDVDPPVDPFRRCEAGPSVIHSACEQGEYCEVDPGICQVGSWDVNRGICKSRPTRGCPEIYQPVCGCDGYSYDNDCFAKARGTSISYKGTCEEGDGSPDIGSRQCNLDRKSWLSSDCGKDDGGEFCELSDGQCDIPDDNIGTKGTCARRPEICKSNYQPVCGCNGHTFSNKCFAQARGMSISHEGPCRIAEPPVPAPTSTSSCRRNQCLNPDTGACDKHAHCITDPCTYTKCMQGTKCIANYCGGCNAKCSPIGSRSLVSPVAAPQLDMIESVSEDPDIDELKIESPISVRPADPDDIAMPVVECDDFMILVIGGEGDPSADGGSGRGGVALRVHGQTNVQINGAVLRGGIGSIQGRAIDIAEAEVTIHSVIADGGILVAKRGSLHVHGGTFTGGNIEVLGDTSAVTFYGCFNRNNMRHIEKEDHTMWSFEFLGEESTISVMVHQGGEIAWDDSGHDCKDGGDPQL